MVRQSQGDTTRTGEYRVLLLSMVPIIAKKQQKATAIFCVGSAEYGTAYIPRCTSTPRLLTYYILLIEGISCY
jgi:hypothetical protein